MPAGSERGVSGPSAGRALRLLAVFVALPASAVLLWGCSVLGGDEDAAPADAAGATGVTPDDSAAADAAGATDATLDDPAALDGEPAGDSEATMEELGPPADRPFVSADAALAAEISLPPGFAAVRWAEGFEEPSALALAPDGSLFVAERGGTVWLLKTPQAPDPFAPAGRFADAEPGLLGLAVASGLRVYLSDGRRVTVAEDADGDGAADTVTFLVRELATTERRNAGLTLGPEGHLYISLMATCGGFCTPADAAAGSIVALNLENRALRVVATGLHQPSALAFAPDGTAWLTHARASLVCGLPGAVVAVREGNDYAGPQCGGESGGARSASLAFGEGVVPRALVWSTSERLPPDLSGGFFVALAADQDGGSGRVQFVRVAGDGELSVRDFAAGFQDPVALAVDADGMIYVADAGPGVIYRIGPPLESDTTASAHAD